MNSDSQFFGSEPDPGQSMLSDTDIKRLATAVAAALRENGALPSAVASSTGRGRDGGPSRRKRRLSSVLHADVVLAGVALLIVTIILIAWVV